MDHPNKFSFVFPQVEDESARPTNPRRHPPPFDFLRRAYATPTPEPVENNNEDENSTATPCITVPSEDRKIRNMELGKQPEEPGSYELRNIANIRKPFKNPNWKPSSRRNKTVKQILAEEARKEASSQAQSGTATPADGGARADDLAAATAKPAVTYMSLDAPPSVKPKKKYCDITGLRAPYTDPKTGLRYHDKEIFQVVRSLPQGVPEQYLEARNANTVLK